MEKLKSNLFQDPHIEEKQQRTAGAAVCFSNPLGGSLCATQLPAGALDSFSDPGP